MFDGNGTEISSTPSNKILQQVPFEESKNITIQISLVDPSSYVKIDYGMLKEPLASGRENKFTVACTSFALICYKIRHSMSQ